MMHAHLPVGPSVLAVDTRLPCGHTVTVARPGDLALDCPQGCDTDRPQHRRR